MPIWGYRAPHEVHEIPMGTGYQRDDDRNPGRRASMVDSDTLWSAHRSPMNEYQAVMEADFLEEPKLSEAEAEDAWMVLQDKIDMAGLTEDERIVVDCVVFGGMSLAETGNYLARSHGVNVAVYKQKVHRIREKAFVKLRGVFDDD